MGYKISINGSDIVVEGRLPKKSYLAFGFAPSMTDADMIRVVSSEAGAISGQDLWSLGHGPP